MWSPKQRQMIEVYVCLVQRCYREHLARQAALQARLLRVDPKLLLRLHAVWLRRETRAAQLMQRSWRATAHTRGGRERLAARRVGHALLRRREEKASSALRAAREREIAELRAVLRLQVTRAPALAPSPSPGPSATPTPTPNQVRGSAMAALERIGLDETIAERLLSGLDKQGVTVLENTVVDGFTLCKGGMCDGGMSIGGEDADTVQLRLKSKDEMGELQPAGSLEVEP